MKARCGLISSGLLLCLVVGACAANSDELRPPAIAYGHDLCDACGMIIDQARFAAATIGLDGVTHKFDDAGDMLQYHAEHPTEQVRAWFVHDYNTEAWLRAETAHFVFSPDLPTPMGHGLAAFEAEATARAFADEWKIGVLSFDEARAVIHTMDHAGH